MAIGRAHAEWLGLPLVGDKLYGPGMCLIFVSDCQVCWAALKKVQCCPLRVRVQCTVCVVLRAPTCRENMRRTFFLTCPPPSCTIVCVACRAGRGSHYVRFVEHGWDETMATELLLNRQALHCAQLRFPAGAVSPQATTYMAPVAPDLRQFVESHLHMSTLELDTVLQTHGFT